MNVAAQKLNRFYYQGISEKRRAMLRLIRFKNMNEQFILKERFDLFETITDLTIKLLFLEYLIAAGISVRDFAERNNFNYQNLLIRFSDPFQKLEVHQTEKIVSTINKEISINFELNKLNQFNKKEG